MIKQVFRRHWKVYVGASLAFSILGILVAPLLMIPAYRATQGALGGMTMLTVEVLFAFLIDFPLATLASICISRGIKSTSVFDGALAGGFFFTLYAVAIYTTIRLSAVSSALGYFALNDVFPPATRAATALLGTGTLAFILCCFILFDLFLCTLGGIVGHFISQAFARVSASS